MSTKLLIPGLISIVFLSCNIIDFTQMDAELDPGADGYILPVGGVVSANFNLVPTQATAEAALTLWQDDQPQQVDYSWSGSRVILTPLAPMQPGLRYWLKVQGNLSTSDGRQFYVSKQVYFYYKLKAPPPAVANLTTTMGSPFVGVNDPIDIAFTQDIDPTTFSKAFTLSPDTARTVTWVNAHHVTVTPQSQWTEFTSYQLSLTADLKTPQGQGLSSTWKWALYCQSETVGPTVSSFEAYTNSGGVYSSLGAIPAPYNLAWKDLIGITFSTSIDFNSFNTAISISPTIAGHWELIKGNFAVFFPDTGWDMNTSYSVNISSDLKSSLQTPTPASSSFSFSTSVGVPLQQVTDITVTDKNSSASAIDVFSKLNTGAAATSQHTTGLGDFVIHIEFSQPLSSSHISDFVSGISFSPAFPTSAPAPALSSISWVSASPKSLDLSYSFTLKAGECDYYLLTIPSGLDKTVNDFGSYLKNAGNLLLGITGQ